MDQSLKDMFSSAAKIKRHISITEHYSHWEIVLYIRHSLQDVLIQDLSLVDRLISMKGLSFRFAAIACDFVRFAPAQLPDDCLRVLLHAPASYPTLNFEERLFDHTIANLDTELHTQLKRDLLWAAISRGSKDWLYLCELHRLIALACLRAMNSTLRFNIWSFPSSYLPNCHSRIQELVRIAQSEGQVSSLLIYACSHWAYHVSFALADIEVIEGMSVLLEQHALHWLEIASIVGKNPLVNLECLRQAKVRALSSSRESLPNY